ncbi:MAG: AbfB domain-containing protein [Planctomycetaceae bacterium]
MKNQFCTAVLLLFTASLTFGSAFGQEKNPTEPQFGGPVDPPPEIATPAQSEVTFRNELGTPVSLYGVNRSQETEVLFPEFLVASIPAGQAHSTKAYEGEVYLARADVQRKVKVGDDLLDVFEQGPTICEYKVTSESRQVFSINQPMTIGNIVTLASANFPNRELMPLQIIWSDTTSRTIEEAKAAPGNFEPKDALLAWDNPATEAADPVYFTFQNGTWVPAELRIVLRDPAMLGYSEPINRFKVVKALNGKEGFVSFESVTRPNHFIRHQGMVLKLHPHQTSNLFNEDASFKPVAPLVSGQPGTYSFASSNVPDAHLRQTDFNGHIGYKLEKEDEDTFKANATWSVTVVGNSAPSSSRDETPGKGDVWTKLDAAIAEVATGKSNFGKVMQQLEAAVRAGDIPEDAAEELASAMQDLSGLQGEELNVVWKQLQREFREYLENRN